MPADQDTFNFGSSQKLSGLQKMSGKINNPVFYNIVKIIGEIDGSSEKLRQTKKILAGLKLSKENKETNIKIIKYKFIQYGEHLSQALKLVNSKVKQAVLERYSNVSTIEGDENFKTNLTSFGSIYKKILKRAPEDSTAENLIKIVAFITDSKSTCCDNTRIKALFNTYSQDDPVKKTLLSQKQRGSMSSMTSSIKRKSTFRNKSF